LARPGATRLSTDCPAAVPTANFDQMPWSGFPEGAGADGSPGEAGMIFSWIFSR